MNAKITECQKSDRPDIPVWQLHFRRDWKVSAIRACTPECGVSARRREAPPLWAASFTKDFL